MGTLTLVALFMLSSCVCDLSIPPSTRTMAPNLDYSTSNATEIIVATEGQEIDGVVEVLEVLKGELSIGAWIEVPRLRCFSRESGRRVRLAVEQPGLAWPDGTKVPSVVSCGRMYLFLSGISTSPDSMVYGFSGLDLASLVLFVEDEHMLEIRSPFKLGPHYDIVPSERTEESYRREILGAARGSN